MKSDQRKFRYELKMECEQIHLPEILGWVKLHSAGFRESYPPRQVNSLYLDTPDLDSFNDHIESVPTRRKLRFRWYGNDLNHACGQLELKCKTERVGWKLVQPIDAVLNLEKCDWFELQWEMRRHLVPDPDGLFSEMLMVTRPLILNCYQREYYVNADERVRLTLDYHQRVYDQWMAARPNLTFCLPQIDQMIIELKCDVEHASHLAEVLSEFPLRVHRHSKYITALDSLLER